MGQILEIMEVKKTNSSFGNWATVCMIRFPWGAITQHTFFSFSKKSALSLKAGDEVEV